MCPILVSKHICLRIPSSFYCSLASILFYFYILLGPLRRVETYSSLTILVVVSKDIHSLQASSISYCQRSVCFGRLEPVPDFTKNQSNCSCHSHSIDIQVFFILNSPVSLGPILHSISHWSSALGYSSSKWFRTIENPFSKSQCHLR
jgi:hypothetical protein